MSTLIASLHVYIYLTVKDFNEEDEDEDPIVEDINKVCQSYHKHHLKICI